MRMCLLAVLFLCVASQAYAGTVSLTGTCSYTTGNPYVNFTLSNNGNEAATNINVAADLSGALVRDKNYYIGLLGSNSLASMSFDLAPIGIGGYAGYFNVSYDQSGTVEDSVFPCMFYFGKETHGRLVMNNTVRENGNVANVDVSVANPTGSDTQIMLQIILPEGVVTPVEEYSGAMINADSSKNFAFELDGVSPEASDTGFIILSYENQSYHFSSISSFVVKGNATTSKSSKISLLPFYLFSSLAIILFALILRIIIRDILR